MVPTRVNRFSDIVRVIGGVLVVPSILGMLLAAWMFLGLISAAGSGPSHPSDAYAAGQAIGFGIGLVFIIVIGVGALVSGLVGWLLLQTKKVFKCQQCGFILDRD
jgi:hypothetical protein